MSEEKFKIEKGIPVPHGRKSGTSKYPFGKMEVGDSFSAGKHDRKLTIAIRSGLHRYLKLNNMEDRKFTIRQIDDELRCWRTK